MRTRVPTPLCSIIPKNGHPLSHVTKSIGSFLIHRCPLHSAAVRNRFFVPTTGRWLWKESERQREHTQEFNVDALECAVVKALGLQLHSTKVKFEKVAEGASNKVFLAIADKRRLIVKIPDPVVPPRWVTASEVATLEFLRAELMFPVPKVLGWSIDRNGPVGCEYVIMEEASGQALNEVWPTLKVEQKFVVVDEILLLQKRLAAASHMFAGYGSIYYTDDTTKLGMSQHLPILHTGPSRFCIGPLADRHFLAASTANNGPWYEAKDYLNAVVRSSIAHVATIPNEDQQLDTTRPFSFPACPVSDTSSTALSNMLEVVSKVIPYVLPRNSQQNLPLLWHKDLHPGNIFVSPDGQITSILDWQNIFILPLFLGANLPSFLEIEPDARILELPDHSAESPELEKADIWETYQQSMLRQYYLADLAEHNSALAVVLEDEYLASLHRQIETFCRISHNLEVDAMLLRETLLRIQRAWPTIAHDKDAIVPCPVNIGDDELKKHQKDGKLYNKLQDALSKRSVNVAGEGWVPAAEYQERSLDLRNAIQDVVAFLDSQELRDFKCRLQQWDLTDWPNT